VDVDARVPGNLRIEPSVLLTGAPDTNRGDPELQLSISHVRNDECDVVQRALNRGSGGAGARQLAPGEGTPPSRRRPWQAEAAAERAGLRGVAGVVPGFGTGGARRARGRCGRVA